MKSALKYAYIYNFQLNYGDRFSNRERKSYAFSTCGFSFKWKKSANKKGQTVVPEKRERWYGFLLAHRNNPKDR